MGFISAEMVPIIIAMVAIIPMTYDVIHDVLENRLDFDDILNASLLRVLEGIIAFMIFPSAVVLIILKIVYLIMSECLSTAFNIVNFLIQPRIIETICYYVAVVLVFLGLNVAIILLLKFIYASL